MVRVPQQLDRSDATPADCLSVHGLLENQVKRSPTALALLAPGREPITYLRLWKQVEETVVQLSAIGIGPGDRVAIVLPNGPEMAVSFLAVATAAVCAPLNPAYRTHEFDFYLSDIKPKAVILGSEVDSPVAAVASKYNIPIIELVPRMDREAGIFSLKNCQPARSIAPVFTGPDGTALVLHTSGTASRPKIVPLTHSNLCYSAYRIMDSLALTSADRCLNLMPLFHIHGLIGAVLSSIAAGASIVCSPGFYVAGFFEWLGEFRPTWYTAVPTMHQAILAEAPEQREVIVQCALRFIRSCSSALPPQIMAELERVFQVPVLEAYGMTEASHQIACNPLPPRKRKPGSVGMPMGCEVAIMDGRRKLRPNQIGEIVIRGKNIMRGYDNDPAVSHSSITAGWFRTGDQGLLDSEGYLFIKGRTKEIINRGGEKISPREIDEALMEHPAVAQALAFALPDTTLGEDVGAAVVLRENTCVTEKELQEFTAKQLAYFKVPRSITFVQEIPKGPTGKPQRIGLAAKLSVGGINPLAAKQREPFVAPQTPMENLLSGLWRQILQIDRIGVNENFFEIGGDSIKAVQLLCSVREATGAELSITTLFRAPNIKQLAVFLTQDLASLEEPRVVAIQPEGSRPVFFCVEAGPLFWTLAHRLGSDQPFLGLHLSDTNKLPTPRRFEDLAAFHVQTLRTVQPEGPYFLGGWCLSGLMAIEIAQQLTAQGQKVALLVLFDTANPLYFQNLSKLDAFRARSDHLVRKLRFHLSALQQHRINQVPVYALERLKTTLLNIKRKARQLSYYLYRGGDLALDGTLQSKEEIIRLLVQRYRPKPYTGRVLLFRSSLPSVGLYGDPQFGWGELFNGGLEVCDIPGDHRDMFLEPYVGNTATKLGACLR